MSTGGINHLPPCSPGVSESHAFSRTALSWWAHGDLGADNMDVLGPKGHWKARERVGWSARLSLWMRMLGSGCVDDVIVAAGTRSVNGL